MTAARKSSVGRSAPRLALLSTLNHRVCVCVSVCVCVRRTPLPWKRVQVGPIRSCLRCDNTLSAPEGIGSFLCCFFFFFFSFFFFFYLFFFFFAFFSLCPNGTAVRMGADAERSSSGRRCVSNLTTTRQWE